jgi:hypothetical protein
MIALKFNADSLLVAVESNRNIMAVGAADSNAAIVPGNDIEGYYQRPTIFT